MVCFSKHETKAATALVLLRSTSLSLPSSSSVSSRFVRHSSLSSHPFLHLIPSCSAGGDERCSSSSSFGDSSNAGDPLVMLALAARCFVIKRGVVRKSRSQLMFRPKNYSKEQNNFPWRKLDKVEEENKCLNKDLQDSNDSSDYDDDADSTSTITTSRSGTRSTLSSNAIVLDRSPYQFRKLQIRGAAVRKRKNEGVFARKKLVMTPSLYCNYISIGVKRKAVSIVKFLKEKGCASEIIIRDVLGNSPDTSKALRMLLRRKDVTRSGVGGKTDPYLYKASGN